MLWPPRPVQVFFFNDTATTEIYTLSLHDALPISSTPPPGRGADRAGRRSRRRRRAPRSEEHTSELQSHHDLVCRLLLEKETDDGDLRGTLILGAAVRSAGGLWRRV